MKLKHRITGSILAIAFATTSALPAATIPNLKTAPAAVKIAAAPRVPVAVAAPRVPAAPVVPKVSVPATPRVPVVKAPEVKVPAVKVPVTPRIVAAPKVPVVKVPVAPKVPSAPRLVAAPKLPVVPKTVQTPAAPKLPSAALTAQTSGAARLKIQGVRAPETPKAAVVIDRVPVSVKVPAKPSPLAGSSQGGSRTARAQGGSSTSGTSASSKAIAARAELVRKAPVSSVAGTLAAANQPAQRFNPIKDIVRDTRLDNKPHGPGFGPNPDLPRSGPSRGNPLQDNVTLGNGTRGTISQGLVDVLTGQGGTVSGIIPTLRDAAPAVTANPATEGMRPFDQGFATRDIGAAIAAAESIGAGTSNPVSHLTGGRGAGDFLTSGSPTFGTPRRPGSGGAVGGGLVGADAVDAIIAIGAFIGAAVTGQASEILPAGAAAVKTTYDAADASAYKNADAFFNMVESWSDPTKPENRAANKLRDAKIKAGVITPDPENQGALKYDLYDLSPGIAQQIGQSRLGKKGSQGGFGDVKPVDQGITGGTPFGAPAGAVVIDKKNNLIGNPGQRGGLGEGGASVSGPNFNGAAGQINLGHDSVVHQDGAGREMDRVADMGNSVNPELNRQRTSSADNNSNNSSGNESSSSTSSKKRTTKKK